MSRRALVTGATGMLGSYITAELIAKGWAVRALVRSTRRREWPEERGVEPALGRLEDPESLARAARDCDVVFHAAAVIGSGGEWKAFYRGNVEGTSNVVRAAGRAGARLVHVSSTAVYGRARYRDQPTDESVELPELPEHDVYGRSKQDAERIVLGAHARGRIWGVAVRPPVMYGCRDRQFAPRVATVLSKGFFPLIGGGGTTLTLTHARSVAQGAVLAAETDAAGGQAYLLANDHPVTVADLVVGAERGLDRHVWAPAVPTSAGKVGFAALKVVLSAAGRGDLARHARGTLEMLTRDNPFTSERARAELGWAPTVNPVEDLAEAFRWWRAHASDGSSGN